MTGILPTGSSRPGSLPGFTLIELLVVLTIVSVLASSISYLLVQRRETLQSLSDDVVRNLYLVRQRSVQDERPYQVKIDLGNNRLQFLDEVVELDEDIAITVRTAQDQVIEQDVAGMTFYPDASSSGGVITLESDDELYEISVIWISGKILTRHQGKSG